MIDDKRENASVSGDITTNKALEMIHNGDIKGGVDLLVQIYRQSKSDEALSLLMQYSPERVREAVGEEEAISMALYFADNKRYNLCMKILEEIEGDLGTQARVNCFLKANEINLAWNEVQKFKDPSMKKVGEGIIYSWLGKREEAERLFQEAISIAPNNQEALLNLTMIEIEKGDYGNAVKYVVNIEGLPPEIAEELCDKLSDSDALNMVSRKWMKVEPDRPEPKLCLAKSYDLKGEIEEAIALLDGLNDWRSLLFKGVLLEKKGDLYEAMDCLTLADKASRHSQSEILFEISWVLFRQGRREEAIKVAEESLKMAKSSKNGIIQALSCGLLYIITKEMKCNKALICNNLQMVTKKLGYIDIC